MLRRAGTTDSTLSPIFATLPRAQTTGAQSSASRTTEYSFTRAFDESAGNETVFREAVEAGVDDALNRASSFLLFSYGATNSKHAVLVSSSSFGGITSPHLPPPSPVLPRARCLLLPPKA